MARPAVWQVRADFVQMAVLGTALALIVYDAWVSYQGFLKLGLGNHAPLAFAAVIFVTQLGVGLLHALGEPYTDITANSDTKFLNDIWLWVLVIIYGTDIASNAIEFGALGKLSAWQAAPVEAIGGGLMILAMSILLTFADEVLLRIHDRIAAATSKNRQYSRRHGVEVRAHQAYLQALQERELEIAHIKGRTEGAEFKFGENL
jgi:hypothetical protein